METLDIALLPVFYFNKMLAIMIPKYCSTRTTVTGLIICLDVWLQYLKRKREGETANLQFGLASFNSAKKLYTPNVCLMITSQLLFVIWIQMHQLNSFDLCADVVEY